MDTLDAGSMHNSIRYARNALKNALKKLPLNKCKLSMTKFGSRYETWSDGNGLFDINMRTSAINWIDQLQANMGGTEMEECLKHVLGVETRAISDNKNHQGHRSGKSQIQLPNSTENATMTQNPDNEYKRQVLLITDAGIYDSREITKLIKEKYENSPRNDGSLPNVADPQNRFFVLGVGAGVSKSLCEDIAKAGGGIAAFCQADASVEEKTARLLAYAVRRPALAVRNEGFEVQFDGDLVPINFDENAMPTGFPTNLFNGTVSAKGLINSDLSEEVTHFKYGGVFDSVPANGIKVRVSTRMNYTLNEDFRSDVFQKEDQVKVVSGRNPLYYAYVKDELNRLQTWLDGYGSTEQAANRKQTMIDLSTTTNLLCSLTAFIGVRSRRQPENSVMDQEQEANLGEYNIEIDNHIEEIMDQGSFAPATTAGVTRRSSIPSGGPIPSVGASADGLVGGRPPRMSGAIEALIDSKRTKVDSVVDAQSDRDKAVAELLKHLKMNGIMPRNEKTDTNLKTLSGNTFDPNDEASRAQFIKQLSEKLSSDQIAKLSGDVNLFQTMAFVIFMLRCSVQNQAINKSIRLLAAKLGRKQLDQKNLQKLAKNMIF